MGCSFPVAEIKFFIYIKNAGFGGGGKPNIQPCMDKTSRLRGRSDLSSSALIPARYKKEQNWNLSPWWDTNHPGKLDGGVISIWETMENNKTLKAETN